MLHRSVLLLLAGVAVGAAAPRFIPKGAKIEPSGFATVVRVALPDYRKTVQRRPKPPASVAAWYAQEQGISEAEAGKRLGELQVIQPVLERLRERLSRQEADNYTGVRLVHDPDWHFLLYFKRDPEATLARYMRNPQFKAAQGRNTQAELDALIKPGLERFGKAGIMGAHGRDGTDGTANFMMTVTEAEYRVLAGREGWGPVPDAIKLGFARQLSIPPIDLRAAPFFRSFANDTRPTMIQPERGSSGRIILRDGCLRLTDKQGKGSLAYFHHETGVGVDAQGYLSLIDRPTGRPSGRIGEVFAWSGPNSLRDNMPGLAELKARCGGAAVAHVGNPESEAAFELRNGR